MKIGVLDVVQIVLIMLKLFKVIDWSWWAIWSPTLFVLGIVVACKILGKIF